MLIGVDTRKCLANKKLRPIGLFLERVDLFVVAALHETISRQRRRVWDQWRERSRKEIPARRQLSCRTMRKPRPVPTPESEAVERALDWGATLAEHERWLRRVVAARVGKAQAVDEVMQNVALAAVGSSARPCSIRDGSPSGFIAWRCGTC